MSCERGVEAVPRVALRGGRGDGDEPGLRGAASGLVRRLRDGAGRGEAAGGAPGPAQPRKLLAGGRLGENEIEN